MFTLSEIIETDPLSRQRILSTYRPRNHPVGGVPIEVIETIFSYTKENWKSINLTCRYFYKIVNHPRIFTQVPPSLSNFTVTSLARVKIHQEIDRLFTETPSVSINHAQRKIILLGSETITRLKSDRFTQGTANFNLEKHIQKIAAYVAFLRGKGFSGSVILEVQRYLCTIDRLNERVFNYYQKLLVLGAYQLPPNSFVENIHFSEVNLQGIWKDGNNSFQTAPTLPSYCYRGIRYTF